VRSDGWRKVVALCAALLLLLPLVLLWGMLRPQVPAESPTGVRTSPMLDNEQRMRLMTYGRECGPGAECEPPLGCLFDVRYLRTYCTDSLCLTDTQCPEGQVCQSLATWGDGPQVRVCVAIGVRQEGEGCDKLPPDKEHACAAGLRCGGRMHRWCARPCHPGDSQACPQGFFCADTEPQPVCLPTCEAQGCPPGQQCIRFDEGASTCAHVHGPNCLQPQCPEGYRCSVQRAAPHPGEVWMACVAPCGKGHPPCAAGSVCDGRDCLQSCDPRGPEACAEGYSCHRLAEDMPYACLPDF
jgi:hypothetical protein